MDFFSGSGTTAHACMHLNSLDNGSRKFILIQKLEPPAKNSQAQKKGYKSICEIGIERIKKAGEQVKKQNPNINTEFIIKSFDC